MSQLSKRRLNEEVSKQLFELTFSLLGRRRDRNEFQKTLLAVLSPSEQIVLAKRIATIYLLVKNVNSVVIRDILKVSTSTISKCIMMLENSSHLDETMKYLSQNEKIKDIFLEAFSSLYAPGVYGINWKNAHRIKREVERKKKAGI